LERARQPRRRSRSLQCRTVRGRARVGLRRARRRGRGLSRFAARDRQREQACGRTHCELAMHQLELRENVVTNSGREGTMVACFSRVTMAQLADAALARQLSSAIGDVILKMVKAGILALCIC